MFREDELFMGVYFVFTNCIPDKIEEYRKTHGSTKTWIANKAGISRQTLNSLETTDNPTIQVLYKLAYALDCKIGDLYKYDLYLDEKE
jgi:DNA-binding XRE family transcriptional regulator